MHACSRSFAALLLLPFMGCMTAVNMPEIPPYHPANASAPPAAYIAPSDLLTVSAPVPAERDMEDGMPGHNMSSSEQGAEHMQHGEASGGEATQEPPSGHGGHAIAAPTPDATMQPAQETPPEGYACPKHPEVTDQSSGICPKCGRLLQAAAPQAPRPIYTCPMHPEVVSPVPGNCTKCGMELAPQPPAKTETLAPLQVQADSGAPDATYTC
ncbi:MAG: hypothetical protein HYZ00_06310, partial [Candidatus Hydrogenedentes bacterium]|nr:hypothetical protein [Candidatus Hydrogenedentota bacterium]